MRERRLLGPNIDVEVVGHLRLEELAVLCQSDSFRHNGKPSPRDSVAVLIRERCAVISSAQFWEGAYGGLRPSARGLRPVRPFFGGQYV